MGRNGPKIPRKVKLHGSGTMGMEASVKAKDIAPRQHRAGDGRETATASLNRWVGTELNSREKRVFQQRIAKPSTAMTLQELGREFKVTRERVRQIEHKVFNKLEKFLTRREAMPLIAHAINIGANLGTAISSGDADRIMSEEGDLQPYQELVFKLAGPYSYDRDWLVLDKAGEDPVATHAKKTPPGEAVDEETLRQDLKDWGLPETRHEAWIQRDPKLRKLKGKWYRMGRRLGDRTARGTGQDRSPSHAQGNTRSAGRERKAERGQRQQRLHSRRKNRQDVAKHVGTVPVGIAPLPRHRRQHREPAP